MRQITIFLEQAASILRATCRLLGLSSGDAHGRGSLWVPSASLWGLEPVRKELSALMRSQMAHSTRSPHKERTVIRNLSVLMLVLRPVTGYILVSQFICVSPQSWGRAGVGVLIWCGCSYSYASK